MRNISYTLSPVLKEELEKIENLRKDILFTPLSPKIELILRWEAMINRIYYSLSLSEISVKRDEIINLLTIGGINKTEKLEKEVIGYKKAVGYIYQNWLGNQETVSSRDISILYDIFCEGHQRVSQVQIKQLLHYLQAKDENPVIKAGLASVCIMRLRPFTQGNGRLARLMSLLFLYKQGFDIRGMLGFEKIWALDFENFSRISSIAVNASTVTLWIEYFTKSVLEDLTAIIEKLKTPIKTALELPSSFWDITERQKEILSLLDIPGSAITNKKIQTLFKVSQITASRDLSKLTGLGLVFQHGKGRSIHYSKV